MSSLADSSPPSVLERDLEASHDGSETDPEASCDGESLRGTYEPPELALIEVDTVVNALEQYKGKAFCYGTVLPQKSLRIFTALGVVDFPLNNVGVERLFEASSPAPFGHGNKTILDSEYRQAMQILDFGVNFELAETSILQQIESHLLPELHESNGRLVAKRDKLNLYGEGGFFKPHQDTPRSAKMIGTLVVVLPSNFEGGEFVLSSPTESGSEPEKTTFNWACKDKIQFVAFFADRHHEILMVTSGVRISISYGLYKEEINEPAQTTSLTYQPLADAIAQKLKDKTWNPKGGILGYHCQYKYAYSGKKGKYVIEACLKGCDAAFWSAAKFLNLRASILPVWENPHRDEDTDLLKDEDIEVWASDPKNSVETLKRGQKLIVSEKWKLSFKDSWYESECRTVPPSFYVPEKPGYEYSKILWCNGYANIPTQVGSSWETCLGADTYLGNEAASEEMEFYNSAGIFIEIPKAEDRA